MGEPLTLIVGNKNYSSWSMRAWVALRAANAPFGERLLKFESQDWEQNIAALSPSGFVPVLWEGEPGKGFATWDTLAIIERAAELFPSVGIWPAEPLARARARALCAEMHAGFPALRAAMPMNLRGRYPGKGLNPEVAREIARITVLWAETRDRFGSAGPYLFGVFCAADAYFAPVATRFVTYGVELAGRALQYQQVLLAAPAVQAWIAAAATETEVVAADEPYA